MPELIEQPEIGGTLKKPSLCGKGGLVLLIVGVILLIAVIAFLVFTVLSTAPKAWSAVFLSNGQMYFGHLTMGRKMVTLQDVHYLQVQEVPAAKEGEQPQQQLSVIKLGSNEVYGPESVMQINRDHILYIQKLTKDSQVVKTIEGQTK